MGLLSPWFLAGALAVGVPFYLHLLRRHTTNPHPFSSLMFFEKRTQSSVRHRRLRYLVLLSLRMMLLLLLALAFASPYINRPATGASGDKLLVLAIDNSFSMRAGSRLEDAKREAMSVLGSAKSGAARAGAGPWFAGSRADAAGAGRLDVAIRGAEHRARGFAREFRRAGSRGSRHHRKFQVARRASLFQRHAEIGHAYEFRRDVAARKRHASAASRGEKRGTELDG